MKLDAFADRLREIERQGLYRRRRIVRRSSGSRLVLADREVLDFCSNDYLGLATHPQVLAAFKRGADAYGVGSTASHLICGHSHAHHALEEELADFAGRERALLFSTGYMANLGVIAAFAGRGSLVCEDRLNHASLLDGAQLAGARLKRYGHRDTDDLAGKLNSSGDCLIASDGVFSMDGDIAPIPELAAQAERVGAILVVDDAHGLGVLGPNGGGALEMFQMDSSQVPVLVGTLGKAFGTFGAFVAGRAESIEYLIQKARTYAYTTALPPAVAEATRASLKVMREEPWRRAKLWELINRFRAGASQLGLPLTESTTAIQPVIVGDNALVMETGARLLEDGFMVSPIRPPTVPANSARLRVTLNANQDFADLDRLLEALAAAVTGCCG